MLQMSQIQKIYRTELIETHALRDLTLSVSEGEFVAITGPSGSGKTTFLNIAGLLESFEHGAYVLDGKDVTGMSDDDRSLYRNRKIGFIFQSFNLIDQLNVAENIELALLYHDMPSAERKQRVADVMDRMGIAHRAKHMPGQLSGGQQQRVAVARAVVGNQPLILADEPTGNLDSAHGQEVMELLRTLNAEGTTIVMVTHSPAHADYARRTVNLFDGHVVTDALRAA